MSKVERALLSVSDKSGIVELARALAAAGVQIISTGGTAKLLEKEGVKVTEVSALHRLRRDARRPGEDAASEDPRRAARAARRRRRTSPRSAPPASSRSTCVVVNLYPFAATVADPDCRLEEAIENIDIGGPAMLRSAAKNYGGVAVVVDPADYARVLAELKASGGVSASDALRARQEGVRAYRGLRRRDRELPDFARRESREFPEVLTLQLHKLQDLRYGENPHQRAAFYRDAAAGRRRASRAAGRCRARSSRTTTSPTPTRRGNA